MVSFDQDSATAFTKAALLHVSNIAIEREQTILSQLQKVARFNLESINLKVLCVHCIGEYVRCFHKR